MCRQAAVLPSARAVWARIHGPVWHHLSFEMAPDVFRTGRILLTATADPPSERPRAQRDRALAVLVAAGLHATLASGRVTVTLAGPRRTPSKTPRPPNGPRTPKGP